MPIFTIRKLASAGAGVVYSGNYADYKSCVADAVRLGVVLDFTDHSGQDLSGVSLNGGSFVGASLEGATLVGTNMIDTNLAKANVNRAKVRQSTVVRAKFDKDSKTDAWET